MKTTTCKSVKNNIHQCIDRAMHEYAEKVKKAYRDDLIKATKKLEKNIEEELKAVTDRLNESADGTTAIADEIEEKVLKRLLRETTGFYLLIDETYNPHMYDDPDDDISNY